MTSTKSQPGWSRSEFVARPEVRAPRFLTIISTLTRGGTERAAVNYALGYKEQGFPSAVLAYAGAGPRLAVLQEAGVEVFVGGTDDSARRAAIEQARAWAPDIIHIHRPGIPDPLPASIVRSLSTPSLRVLETNVFGYVDDSPDRELFDVHLQLSRWCMWKWRQGSKSLQPPSFSVVVPYSVNVDSFKPLSKDERAVVRQGLGLPPDAVAFGRIGQPIYGKWSPWIIDSFAEVAAQQPNAWLAVVGLPEELQAAAKRLPEETRSRILQLPMADTDDELARRYAAMDVFVHVSQKGESFGMVLCEAMLMEMPVITASTPFRDNSQVEVVRDHVTGLVVDSRSKLTSAMLSLAGDSELRARLGQQGPGWVRENYAIQQVSPRLVELAQVALAAGSREEMVLEITKMPGYKTSVMNDTPQAILQDAGLTQSAITSMLAATVNTRASRMAIGWARSLASIRRRIR